MNNAQLFLLLSLALSLLVVLVLAWSVLRAARAATKGGDREHVMSHVSVYREQLAELERELAQGSLDQQGFDLSQQELTQRLMEDAPGAATAPAPAAPARTKLLISSLTLTIPVLAFVIYFYVGTPIALDPALLAQANSEEQITPQKLETMAEQLSQRLEKEPKNAEAWVLRTMSSPAMGVSSGTNCPIAAVSVSVLSAGALIANTPQSEPSSA